jgi:hypothetical protein
VRKKGYKNNIQKKILGYLAIQQSESDNGGVVTTEQIKDALDLSTIQMACAKRLLLQKKLIVDHGRGKLSIRILRKKYEPLLCKLLTTKNGNGFQCGRPYCPVRHCILPENDLNQFCGVIHGVNFIGNDPEKIVMPHCPGWTR